MDEQNRERQKFDRDYHANAKELRRLRTRAHLSLKKLEGMSGVNYTTINRIERGHNRSPQWATLHQLADALEVGVDVLVIYDDEIQDAPTLNRANEMLIAEKRQKYEVRDEEKRTSERTSGSGEPSSGESHDTGDRAV